MTMIEVDDAINKYCDGISLDRNTHSKLEKHLLRLRKAYFTHEFTPEDRLEMGRLINTIERVI